MPPPPSSERIAPVARGPSTPRSMASTTRGPKTMPSSSELEARRLAPITPLQLASPATQRPGQRRRAVEVGEDAAAAVVGRRRDGEPVLGGVQPDVGELGRDRREPFGEAVEPGGVEPQVLDALVDHAGGDRSAHLVAREQLVDEPLALAVPQQRAVPAQRLGEQRAWHHGMVERGGVELLELDVGDGDTGSDRHRHPVPRRLRAGWW